MLIAYRSNCALDIHPMVGSQIGIQPYFVLAGSQEVVPVKWAHICAETATRISHLPKQLLVVYVTAVLDTVKVWQDRLSFPFYVLHNDQISLSALCFPLFFCQAYTDSISWEQLYSQSRVLHHDEHGLGQHMQPDNCSYSNRVSGIDCLVRHLVSQAMIELPLEKWVEQQGTDWFRKWQKHPHFQVGSYGNLDCPNIFGNCFKLFTLVNHSSDDYFKRIAPMTQVSASLRRNTW